MARSGSVVLDASALICLARREPGWETVAAAGFSGDVSADKPDEHRPEVAEAHDYREGTDEREIGESLAVCAEP